jgi:hypothetical protein
VIRRATGTGVMMAAMALLSGCAGSCGATSDRLAALQRGMSYQEAAGIMGCPGTERMRQPTGEMSVEWDGPGPNLFTATDIEFVDDKLLYYTTRSRSGF